MNADCLLAVEDLSIDYRNGKRAVDHVNLSIRNGERVGLVGESGSGKSSLARAILGLEPTSFGTISFAGGQGGSRRERARIVQMVFQDPYHSLNPRKTVVQTLSEALAAGSAPPAADRARAAAAKLLSAVHLDAGALDRYPHEFSGGQRQRICIARALAPKPRLLVCDEAVSALDVTTQRSIVELLGELGDRTGVALLFITHDLPLVEALCARVLVMDRGRVVEEGPVGRVFSQPESSKTRQLLDSVLRPPPPDGREQR